ncbi:general secretion pathway protein F [Mizugakiibacter sediminis]|uniref:General secretion pathway protein F n=1 Tax=Mizugakiibacter sediminis TaxID=1475481 RepID=A0A0K8QR68_9GAMM|nr:type II secretion system inner membrane protein GspF [Mizugakiibacter sediminis]GAP67131.1 general secretion pathway protein F [Mizugakiibacter sediminis]
MALFRYRAVDAAGEIHDGEMDAASVEEVVACLQDQGQIPLDARAGGAEARGTLAALFRRQPLGGAQLAQFTLQLATLLGAGQPLDRALQLLMDLPEGERAQRLIERVRDRVRGGATLSDALEAESGAFPRLYVSMVRAGEAGGSLEETLKRLAEYLERSRALRETVTNALVYPAFLLTGVLGSLVLLLAYVVPQFVPIFADMNVEIPLVTRIVMAIGTTLRDYWWLLLLLLAGAGYGLRARLRDPDTRRAWDERLLRRRVIGPLVLKAETARLTRTLGTLLKNGVSLLAALGVARNVVGNRALAGALDAVAEEVKGGAGLGHALAQSGHFPRLALSMIAVGEESGALDAMLLKVADTFDQDVRNTLDRLLAALVPVLTIVMALLVALIMLAVLLPLLSLTGSMG